MSKWEAAATFYRQHLRKYGFLRVPKEALFYARWYLRWRVVQPAVQALLSGSTFALWYLRWRIVRPLARATLPASWLAKYHRLRGIELQGWWIRLTTKPMSLLSQTQAIGRGLALEPVQVFAASTSRCAPPEMRPLALAQRLPALPPLETSFPPIVIHQLTSATVTGRTNLVSLADVVLHHDLARFSHDYTSEELHGRIHINPNSRSIHWLISTAGADHLAYGVAFTDAVSANYAHWLTEVLPRVHAYVVARPASQATALFDAGLHQNLKASINLILPTSMARLELAPDQRITAEQLDLVSAAGYIPFDRRTSGSGHSHGSFSATALSSLRNQLLSRVGQPERPLPRRLLLRRSSVGRALVNEQAIEAALVPQGFAAIYPERLSFAQQVQLFRDAEIVVGATGAAMANIIFCPSHARIFICISAHPSHGYNYWQAIAGAVGNQVRYVLGRIAGSAAPGVHSDFSIDIGDLMEVIAPLPAGSTCLGASHP